MKTFNDFDSAFNWIERSVKSAKDKAIEVVAEQVYKDSEKYTYRDTGALYDSGQLYSQFDKGTVVLRTPYARRRYYEGGVPSKNANAIPQWFEKTKKENTTKYRKMYGKAIENEVQR